MVENWPELIDTIATSISANSGRSCICASTVITPRYGDEIAQALAEKLSEIQPLSPEDDNARLSGFANPAMAEWIDSKVEEGLEKVVLEIFLHLSGMTLREKPSNSDKTFFIQL